MAKKRTFIQSFAEKKVLRGCERTLYKSRLNRNICFFQNAFSVQVHRGQKQLYDFGLPKILVPISLFLFLIIPIVQVFFETRFIHRMGIKLTRYRHSSTAYTVNLAPLWILEPDNIGTKWHRWYKTVILR